MWIDGGGERVDLQKSWVRLPNTDYFFSTTWSSTRWLDPSEISDREQLRSATVTEFIVCSKYWLVGMLPRSLAPHRKRARANQVRRKREISVYICWNFSHAFRKVKFSIGILASLRGLDHLVPDNIYHFIYGLFCFSCPCFPDDNERLASVS